MEPECYEIIFIRIYILTNIMGYIFVYIESYIDRAKVKAFFDKKRNVY